MMLKALDKVHPTGFEPVTSGSVDCESDFVTRLARNGLRILTNAGYRHGYRSERHQTSSTDALWQVTDQITKAWPRMPAHIRTAILALAEAATSCG